MAISKKGRRVRYYKDKNGNSPCEKWYLSLRDHIGKAKISRRLSRAGEGNFGDHKNLGDGVWELREHYGPGYRIYFALAADDSIILLLAGGTKRDQQSDIDKAKENWQCHNNGGG